MIRSRTRIAAAAVIAIGGAMVAWLAVSRGYDGASTPAGRSEQATTGRPAHATSLSATSSSSRTVGDNLEQEVGRVLRDPAHLQKLLAMYAAETDLDTRGALLAVLRGAANDSDTILRFAIAMASSPDPAKRQDGLALLGAFPLDNAEVRGLLARQISEERDPAMLGRLVGMLEAAVVPTEDSAQIAEQLARLRQHSDPGVRAASVMQSMAWDKGGDLEEVLHRAMLDPAEQVRRAAIGGATVSGVRSPRLKDALLEIAANPASGSEERQAAVFALQNFPLSRAEYAIYRQAMQMTDDDDGHEQRRGS